MTVGTLIGAMAPGLKAELGWDLTPAQPQHLQTWREQAPALGSEGQCKY